MLAIRHFLPALLVLCMHTASAQSSQQDSIRMIENGLSGWAKLEGRPDPKWSIEERLAYYKIPGITIAVVRNYKIAWAKGYGYADKEANIPVTPQTLFQAASISKSLNGVGILKLVQQGKLKLDEDINTYLKSWHPSADSGKITIANLLSHSAGLTVHGFAGYETKDTLPTVVQILRGQKPANSPEVKPAFAPGIRTQYSGGGTTITQLILTDITNEKYDEFMQREVLKPLGMTQSFFSQPPPPSRVKELATAYSADGKPIPGKYHIYPEMAAAGLWTNPTDLCKYIIETQLSLMGKSSKVLSADMNKTRLTPLIDKQAALGVFIVTQSGRNFFGHNGGNEGFRCVYYGSTTGGDGMAIMVNSDEGGIIGEVVRSIGKVYGWGGFSDQRPMKVIDVPVDSLKQFEGTYTSEGPTLTCSLKGNDLFFRINNSIEMQAYFISPKEFFVMNFPMIVKFVEGKKGYDIEADGDKFIRQ